MRLLLTVSGLHWFSLAVGRSVLKGHIHPTEQTRISRTFFIKEFFFFVKLLQTDQV